MPPSGHPGVVTGLGCPLCDGQCRHPWQLPSVHPSYPFLPKEMVDAMNPQTQEPTDAPEPAAVRGRRRGGNRMKPHGGNTAHEPAEDRQ
jgi:hypothetical protein